MLTGMRYLPPFAIFGSRTAVEEARLDEHIAQWLEVLAALVEDRLEAPDSLEVGTLNEDLSSVIRSAQ